MNQEYIFKASAYTKKKLEGEMYRALYRYDFCENIFK